ncbi:hypothetical protein [Pedobacter sp. P26]|uniref:hypothetical protein n=1 Tax=Pedobacter sp. P26 TaxID=3423956 RepID=UPI003D67CAD0
MSKGKEIYFKAAALSLPLVFLCFIEILLRFFNYGFDPSLFIKDPDQEGYMMMNPTASYKFFLPVPMQPRVTANDLAS